jgi:hypothetical protein
MKNFQEFINESAEAPQGLYLLPLDMAIDDDEDVMIMLQEITEQFNLQIVGLLPIGPAGGNSEITFRGKYQDIENFLTQWFFAHDPSDVEYYMTDVVEKDHQIPFTVHMDSRFVTKGRRKYVKEDGSPL